MPQLPQCLRLNLPDSFPRNTEALPNLFQRVFAPILQPETQPQNLLLPRRQTLQHLSRLLMQVEIDHLFARRGMALIDDEIAQMRFVLFAHRRLQ